MGKSAGSMTEFKNEAGRPIYISDSGEIVSEKSVTIKMGNKFVNVPSIHDGIEYSEDELADMLNNKEIKPTSTHKSVELAEKAAQKRSPSLLSEKTAKEVAEKYETEMLMLKAKSIEPTYRAPLYDPPELPVEKAMKKKKSMDEQMLSFAEGGLKQEGGTVDPVSGNEVPTGSTKEEVRDDIPAQLSEGEFVFPADVVRYIGLENLMKLRQKAKAGLQKMEDMGQMGNSDEAIMDDDGAYDDEVDSLIDEYDPFAEEPMEFAPGGAVPTTEQMIFGGAGTQSPVEYTSQEYIGPAGERITITLINGKEVTPVPEGYKKFDPTKAAKEAPAVAQPKIEKPKVVNDGSDSEEEARREAERQAQMEMDKQINSTLASLDPEFAKLTAADPFMTGDMSSLKQIGIGGAVMAGVKTHLGRTAAIERIAQNLNMDLEQYKNTGLAGAFSTYDDKRFADDIKAMQEDKNFAEKAKARKELEKDYFEDGDGDRPLGGMSIAEARAQMRNDMDEIEDAVDAGTYGVKSTEKVSGKQRDDDGPSGDGRSNSDDTAESGEVDSDGNWGGGSPE